MGFSAGEGVDGWTGIPYAAPPVGSLRWRAPRPAKAWEGTREATRFGEACTQFNGPMISSEESAWGKPAGSEDCLVLDVYAPRFKPDRLPQEGERRPVMLWIHGGGNTMGSTTLYAGARNLAEKHGVIVVAIQYRLGVLGWFHHPALHDASASEEDRSGNFGTLDLIQALHWVRNNIGAFGGDPQNVTIFGESAGGMNVLSLLVAPKAAGLFHRAIVQSGLPASSSMEAALHFEDDPVPGDAGSSQEILVSLLQKDSRAKDRAEAKRVLGAMSKEEIAAFLRSRTPAQLLSHFKLPASGMGMYAAPYIFRDGTVLPAEPLLEALGNPERLNEVPVVLGTTRDEYKLFLLGNERFVSKLFGVIPRVRDPENYERVSAALSQTWKVVGADLPAERLQKAGVPVFTYRYDWDEGPKNLLVDLQLLLGAAHGTEIRPLFLEFDGEDPFYLSTKDNEPGRREVGEAMAAYWTEFAYSGSPGRGRGAKRVVWKAAEEGRMIFDSTAGGGVRMGEAGADLEAITAQTFDGAKDASALRERCEISAGMFQLLLLTDSWKPSDFHAVTGSRCTAFDYESLRSKDDF